ncbi:MAG: GNAT family N-acetyltransferase [Acidobacteriota bacterium]
MRLRKQDLPLPQVSGSFDDSREILLTSMKLRAISECDEDALHPLLEDFVSSHGTLPFRPDYWTSFKIWMKDILSTDEVLTLLAESNGKAVGFAVASVQQNGPLLTPDRIGYVSLVVVGSRSRRNGVGRGLWNGIREWFVSKGITEVQLYTEFGNEDSSAFWGHLGFVPYLDRRRISLRK